MSASFDTFLFQDFDMTDLRQPSQSDCSDPHSLEDQGFELFYQGSRKLYRCTFADCGKTFKFKSEIMRHLLVHFPSRPFECPVEDCRKAFKRRDALENHLRIHSEEKPYVCNYPSCNSSFTSKSALKYHILKHGDQKIFNCTFPGCGKSFLTKAQLKQHEKAETFHRRILLLDQASELEQNEPTMKMRKCDDTILKDYPFETLIPKPRFATTLQWETKNSDESELYSDETLDCSNYPILPPACDTRSTSSFYKETSYLGCGIEIPRLDPISEPIRIQSSIIPDQFWPETNKMKLDGFNDGSEFQFLSF